MPLPNATLREALALLEGAASQFTDTVLSGKSVPWFGSGISRERFPGVSELLLDLCNRLHARANVSNPDCPFIGTIQRILALAPSTALDPRSSPATWDETAWKHTAATLVDKYATVLAEEVHVAGGSLTVRWDILNLIGLYSNPAIVPDAEHEFAVLLLAEGVWSQAVTTNWDALIEGADSLLSDGERPLLQSIACNDELNVGNPGAPRLLKIHGCAAKVAVDLDRYRPYIVATELDIRQWTDEGGAARPFHEAMRNMLRERTVIFIGLSGQDFNLQMQFIAARLTQDFDPLAPRVTFCESGLSTHHQTILRAFYSENGFRQSRDAIIQSALLQLYAKPLLGALYFELLFRKVELVVSRSTDMRAGSAQTIRASCVYIKERIIASFEALTATHDHNGIWRELAYEIPAIVSRCVSLYRKQEKTPTARSYSSLCPGSLAQLQTDPNLPQLRFQWFFWAIGLLTEGARRGFWTISCSRPADGSIHTVTIASATTNRPLILIDDYVQGGVKCMENEIWDAASRPEAVILYPHQRRPGSVSRTAKRTLMARGNSHQVNEVWLGDLYDDSANDCDVLESLRLELA